MTLAVHKPLSGWWAERTHRALGTTTDKARRLALALGAIKSVIRVVDRSLPPMSVDWASVDDAGKGMSYTDFKGHAIHVNPAAMLDEGIDHGDALDVSLGFALHEASHSQESRDRYKYLVKREVYERPKARPDTAEDMEYRRVLANPNTVFDKATGRATKEVPAFEPMRIAAYLWNLVEDVRIEQVTGRNWPGFAPYFGRVLRYMWTEMRKKHEVPTEYGSKLQDRLRVVYLACRYPKRFSPTDETLVAEVAWWQAWQHDYLSDTVDTPTTIQRGLDHLAEDEATAEELQREVDAEKAERAAGERLKAQIDRLIREGIPGGYEMCVTEQGEVVPLDAETAEEVRKLVREGLIEVRTVVSTPGVSNAPVLVSKPEETPASRRAYVGKPDATTEALRAALVFRPSAPQYDQKLLKSGHMDDEELYRWGVGDYRVFSERVIESKPDVFLGLLIDSSGSMCDGYKLETAQRLAQQLVWSTHDQEGVEVAVWAHTADTSASSADIYRIWQKGDPMSRLGIIDDIDHLNNRDSQSVEWCATQVALAEQPEKVLIVLSDGQPQANGLGGRPAQLAVRDVVRWAAGRGVRVIQVAIGRDLRPDEQARMYPEWIPYSNDAMLPRQLGALLGRFV
jgi:hypothetical protein